MKFQPRSMGEAAEVSSGGGSRGWRKELPQLAAWTAAVMVVIWLLMAGLSHIAVRFITLEQETGLLAAMLPEIDTFEPATDQEKAQHAMLTQALEKLTAHPDCPDIPFQLVLMDAEEVNAFALPGGVIAVTRGLLETLGHEEIAHAFVLAHEIGHFKHRDHMHRIVRQLGNGAALSMIFGSSGAAALTNSANDFAANSYSRKQESAADEFGLRLVRDTYGHTEGTQRLFEELMESEKLPDWAYMFSTHPDTRGRLERLRNDAQRP